MYKILPVLLFLLVLLFGCVDSNEFNAFTIGDDFLKSETNISVIDTFTVRLSTFKADSVATSGQKIGLFGKYIDKELGQVESKCYCKFGLPTDGIVVDEDDLFDSLTVKLRYDKYVFGDTLKNQLIHIYRLTEEPKPKEDDSNLYNISSFNYNREPIGSIEITPLMRENDKDLEIRLSNAFGEELFQKMGNKKDSAMTDVDRFLEYFPGIVIASETKDGAILSVSFDNDTLCTMNVYSHRYDYQKVETVNVFPLNNSSHQFNQITCDRKGTFAEPIRDGYRNDVNSSITGNQAFVQGGIGLYTRIEFPGLYRMLEMSEKRFLLRAELTLKPVLHTYDDLELPATLSFFESNKVNQNLGALTTSDGKSNLTANLVTDKYHPEETYYTVDVTSFISSELADGVFDVNHAILVGLSSSDLGKSVHKIAIADKSRAKYKPVLKLYYVFYN